jgi:hypothetical protein
MVPSFFATSDYALPLGNLQWLGGKIGIWQPNPQSHDLMPQPRLLEVAGPAAAAKLYPLVFQRV